MLPCESEEAQVREHKEASRARLPVLVVGSFLLVLPGHPRKSPRGRGVSGPAGQKEGEHSPWKLTVSRGPDQFHWGHLLLSGFKRGSMGSEPTWASWVNRLEVGNGGP